MHYVLFAEGLYYVYNIMYIYSRSCNLRYMITLPIASEIEAVKKVSAAMIAELQQTLRQGILFATVSIIYVCTSVMHFTVETSCMYICVLLQ